MIACLRVLKLPNLKARGELALGFWWHINPHVAYKKLMLQSYFLTRNHFYICDKFTCGPMEKDEVYLSSPDLEHYQPTDSIVYCIHSGQRSRHIKGHKCTGSRAPRAAAPQSVSEN